MDWLGLNFYKLCNVQDEIILLCYKRFSNFSTALGNDLKLRPWMLASESSPQHEEVIYPV